MQEAQVQHAGVVGSQAKECCKLVAAVVSTLQQIVIVKRRRAWKALSHQHMALCGYRRGPGYVPSAWNASRRITGGRHSFDQFSRRQPTQEQSYDGESFIGPSHPALVVRKRCWTCRGGVQAACSAMRICVTSTGDHFLAVQSSRMHCVCRATLPCAAVRCDDLPPPAFLDARCWPWVPEHRSTARLRKG